MDKSSGAINRGGRPTKASHHADGGGCAAAAASAAARPRGRPRRPPPVTEDSDEQADVRAARARLLRMGASCLRDMCRTILPHNLAERSGSSIFAVAGTKCMFYN